MTELCYCSGIVLLLSLFPNSERLHRCGGGKIVWYWKQTSSQIFEYTSTRLPRCFTDNVHSIILINSQNIFQDKYHLQWKNFDKSLLKMQIADAATNLSFLYSSVRVSLNVTDWCSICNAWKYFEWLKKRINSEDRVQILEGKISLNKKDPSHVCMWEGFEWRLLVSEARLNFQTHLYTSTFYSAASRHSFKQT